MEIAHVAAQREARRQLEVLAYAVEQCARELLVKAHVVGAHTYYIICAAVAEAHGCVQLGACAAESHDVDGGLRVHVYESYLVGYGVAGVVD